MTIKMNPISKWAAVLTVAFVLISWIDASPQQKSDKKPAPQKNKDDLPKCNCYIPKTKEYGVIKGDNCTSVKCQRKTPEK
jgi:hypothetical protein